MEHQRFPVRLKEVKHALIKSFRMAAKIKEYSIIACLALQCAACQRPPVGVRLIPKGLPPDYYITRLHRRNSQNPPIVFGTVYKRDDSGLLQEPGSLVTIDKGVPAYTDVKGLYAYSLAPGQHQVSVGQVGYFGVRITRLLLQAGDSVRIDFYLLPTMESIP